MLSPRDKKRLARAERKLAKISVSILKNPRTDTFQPVDDVDGSLILDDVEFHFHDQALIVRDRITKIYAMTVDDVVEFALD